MIGNLALKIKQRLKVEVPHRRAVGEKSRRQLACLAEKRRVGRPVRRPAKSSVGRREIDHVEYIVRKRAKRDAVAPIHTVVLATTWIGPIAAQPHSRHAPAPAAWPATTTNPRSLAFFHPRANAKGLGYAHIHRELNRGIAVIDRDDPRTTGRSGADIEIPILGRIHIGGIGIRRGEDRPVVEERITIVVLAELDVERRTRRSD